MKKYTIHISLSLMLALGLGIWWSAQNNYAYQPRLKSQAVQGIDGYAAFIQSIKLNKETGTVSIEEISEVLRQIDKQRALKNKTSWPLKWSFSGPDNFGGRTRDILIDRNDNNILFAGGTGGMLFKSTNKGASWRAVTQNEANFGVTTLAQTTDGTIYYGTGEGGFVGVTGGENGTPGFQGFGIFKSTDGEKFTLLPGSTALGFINIIRTSPDGNTLFAGSQSGLRYSNDGGQTWTILKSGNCTDIAISKDNKILAYVGSVMNFSTNPTDPSSYTIIQETPAPDETPISLGANKRMVATWSDSDPNYGYVVRIGTISTAVVPGGSNGEGFNGLFQTKDGGQTWTKVVATASLFFAPMSNIGNNTQGAYDACVAVDPRNRERVFIGGVQMAEWTPEKGPRITGNNFNDPQNPFGVHADKHRFVFDTKGETPVMYIASDGGVSRTTNSALDRYTDLFIGYNTTQFYGISASRDGYIVGGTQDNNTILIDKVAFPRKQGKDIIGGDGFQTAVSKRTPRILFGESQYGNLRRSLNSGGNLDKIWDNRICRAFPPGGDATAYLKDNVQPNNIFNTPLHLWEGSPELLDSILIYGDDEKYDKRFKARLFIAMNDGVWMTTQPYGQKFRGSSTNSPVELKANTTRWFKVFNHSLNSGTLHYLEATPDGNHLFVTTASGQLFRVDNLNAAAFDTAATPALSIDAALSFKQLHGTGGLVLGGRAVTGLSVDQNDPNHVVITVGNYGNGPFVYRSRNALSDAPTWVSIQGNLPRFPCYHPIINEANSNEIILGTEFGIWATQNGNSDNPTWVESIDGTNPDLPFPRVPVFDLVQVSDRPWSGPKLYAGTHGMGIWESSSTLTSVEKKPTTSKTYISIYPNPAADITTIKTEITGKYKISVVNLDGKEVFNGTGESNGRIQLNVKEYANGYYFVKLENGTKTAVTKFVVSH